MISQRDTFISLLFEKAQKDKDIYMISVDMGAPSLDRWREELPDQFFTAGISEQNAINFAAGLAATGKKVYVYFMACWVARCFEQIRYSCAIAENPITILGNGVGLGYTPAGPAHNPTEDIAYMRSLCGIEVHSPCNNLVVRELVNLSCQEPKLRYIRLERRNIPHMQNLYENLTSKNLANFAKIGICLAKPGLSEPPAPARANNKKVCILTSGYLLGRAFEVSERLSLLGYETSVVDLWRIKPINSELFKLNVCPYDILVTLEEQTLSGGFGSAVAEMVADLSLKKEILRIGLPERYIFENDKRDGLLNKNGLSVESIYDKIRMSLE